MYHFHSHLFGHEISKLLKNKRKAMLNFYELSMMIISGTAILSQMYVIYLIRFQSPAQMDSYRRFIYMTTVIFSFILPVITNIFKLFDLLFTVTLGVIWAPTCLAPFFAVRIDGIGSYFGKEFCDIMVDHN